MVCMPCAVATRNAPWVFTPWALTPKMFRKVVSNKVWILFLLFFNVVVSHLNTFIVSCIIPIKI